MSLENLEGRSEHVRIVEFLELSTEEKLIEIGAEKDGYGMRYENLDLGIVACWRRVFDKDLGDTKLYELSYYGHIEESTMH